MKCKAYNLFFETVSSKIRLRILELLKSKPMSVSEICKTLNEEQSKISHNLKNLADCNFLDIKRDGKRRIYSLNKDTILPLMKLVEKHVEKHCKDICRGRVKNESLS